MKLPDFLFVGPMKSGTTWVHEYLSARGDVCMPLKTKETFFFDRNFTDGIQRYGNYFDHFSKEHHKVAVEIGPSLFHKPEAMKRVSDTLPDANIIFTVRDPVSRSWSHYQHLKRYGYTTASLQDAVEAHPEIITASQYDLVIAKWKQACPKSKFHQLEFRMLQVDQDAYIREICNVVGLDYMGSDEITIKPSNKAASPPSFLLAKYCRQLSYFLKDRGAYAIVNTAKSIGLQKMIFGSPNRNTVREQMSDNDEEYLRSALGIDFEALRKG